ncbi:MAG: ABC transporter ATP-binding protein [Propionibacteriaceae bacterium]|jgi:peptide/nickel transport system ATP-binding protein|nr:ABC transporter ATP-binding protein [Propionibacteriaceae bacterium]
MSDPILSVRDLHVSFPSEAGRVDAVRGVSFDLYPGETLGIVGESGSGKSVTSLAVMGLLAETAKVTGSVIFDGHELLGLSDKEMTKFRGTGIAMVFQDPLSSLTPVYTVGDQISEALAIHTNLSKQERWEKAVDLLDKVGIPNPKQRAKSFPHEFSGGMRQRVIIAIAIANNPKVIIADEPTTALDVTIQAQVMELLKVAQAETGAATILITHDMGLIAGMADDVIVMYAGKPVEQAPVMELFGQPHMPYTIGLLGAIPKLTGTAKIPLIPIKGNPPMLIDLPDGCPFAPRCPVAVDKCWKTEPDLKLLKVVTDEEEKEEAEGVDVMFTGNREHQVACHRYLEIKDQKIDGEPVYPVPELDIHSEYLGVDRVERPVTLEVKHLSKTFPLLKGAMLKRRVGSVYAVNDITFDLRAAETLAIVGESGSGKTTTLLEIMNFDPKTEGEIYLGGEDIIHSKSSVRKAHRKDIQVVFQDPAGALDPRFTVYDIIAEPLKAFGYPKAELPKRVAELMDVVGLDPAQADRFPTAFSGGQRQRVCIARALAPTPKIVALDEPVSALDVSIRAGVLNLLQELQGQFALSYLFVSHDLSVVRHISDRVAVMYLGRFVEIGPTAEIFTNPRHPYTEALLSAIPIPDPKIERTRQRIVLEGDLPSPTDNQPGCRFAGRCPLFKTLSPEKRALCLHETPELEGEGGSRHLAACHYR